MIPVPCSLCSCKTTPTPKQQSQPAALYRRCLPSKTCACSLVKLIVAVFKFPVLSTLSVKLQQSQPLCRRCLKPSKTCACSLAKLVRLFQNFYTALHFILQNNSRANQLLFTSSVYPARLAPALLLHNLPDSFRIPTLSLICNFNTRSSTGVQHGRGASDRVFVDS